MDNIKQLGKNIKQSHTENDSNTRRIGKLFPHTERVTDKINPTSAYSMEFQKGAHNTAHLNLYLRDYDIPCVTNPPELFASMTAKCPQFGAADGHAYAEHDATIIANTGGFVQSGDGYIVPVTGIYQIHFVNGTGGVDVGGASILASIRVDGGVVAQTLYGSACTGLCFFGPTIDMWATVSLAAGSVVAGYLAASNIAFYTPSDLCGLFGGSTTSITLVGSI